MGIGDKSIYCPVYGTVIRAGWECATLPKKGFGQRVVVRIGSTAYYMYGSNGIYARQNRKNGLGITKNLLSGIELE